MHYHPSRLITEKLKEEFNVRMCDHVSEMELTCF